MILILGTWLVSRFGTTPDLLTATLHVLDKMLGEIGLVRTDVVRSPLWVTILLDVLGAAVILTSTYLFFKPPPETHTLSAADEARIRTLLRSYGDWDSLGYFATRRDKSIVWNTGDPATAQAGVPYRVIGSASLASGNPVGDPSIGDLRSAVAGEVPRPRMVPGRDGCRRVGCEGIQRGGYDGIRDR